MQFQKSRFVPSKSQEKDHTIQPSFSVWRKNRLTIEQVNEAFKKVMERHEREPIERLIAYGFSPTEIEDLEQKVWGITKNFVLATQLFKNLEKALGVSKDSGDLEKAYFKIKLKEMTKVWTGLSLDYSWYELFLAQVKPLDPEVFAKLEFYGFRFEDFMKIESDLFPYLEQIITDVEKIYGVPEKLSKDVKEQVKDHLMQELGIIKIN